MNIVILIYNIFLLDKILLNIVCVCVFVCVVDSIKNYGFCRAKYIRIYFLIFKKTFEEILRPEA